MTPLEAMREYVAQSNGSLLERRSYAGRLDPMAEGLLLVLEGERCSEQDTWQHHSKTYAWELLLGFASDSFDLLGLVEEKTDLETRQGRERHVAEAVRLLRHETAGERLQAYPPYSSCRVRGHPLFWWAQQGRLAEIVVPQINVTVFSCQVGAVRWIPASSVLHQIEERIALVSGDGFRQEAILQRWREILAPLVVREDKLPVISVSCKVSSGTYIRSLADETGKRVGCGGLAWRICRTSLGEGAEALSLQNAFPLQPVARKTFNLVMSILKVRGYI